MLPYWIFFLVPAAAALVSSPHMRFRAGGTRSLHINETWILIILVLTMIIGFRYEVGGDWGNYFRYLFGANNLTFADLATKKDPGYWALNVLSVRLNLGITGVNTLGAFIFSIGLVLFCRNLPRPWLALACAVPYLVTVVAMGYTRQAIALGLVMIGFVMLSRSRFAAFVIWVLLAALFHMSAVLMIPLAALTISKNRYLNVALVSVGTYLGYTVLLADSASQLVQTYTDENIQSSGAFIRLAMNALPAVLLLLYHRKFIIMPSEKKLWTVISLISIGMFITFFPTNLTTALDRMALYFIPLQLVAFAYLPDAIGRPGGQNQHIVAGILIYYAAVMFVWLNFASHSYAWIPYQLGIG
jgi:hypothetical protein